MHSQWILFRWLSSLKSAVETKQQKFLESRCHVLVIPLRQLFTCSLFQLHNSCFINNVSCRIANQITEDSSSFFLTSLGCCPSKSSHKRTLKIRFCNFHTHLRIINSFSSSSCRCCVLKYIITCVKYRTDSTQNEKKILNVVDISVSLNFMHMKMCLSFSLVPLLWWKIHHSFLLQILISR